LESIPLGVTIKLGKEKDSYIGIKAYEIEYVLSAVDAVLQRL